MITPELAKELLSADFDTVIEIGATKLAEADIIPVMHRPILRTTPGEELLADYAQEMAETIASMLWEYAAVVEIKPGVWRYLSHGETVTQLSHKAKWFTTPGDAGRYAKDRGWPEHTVRRLVSDPEVIK